MILLDYRDRRPIYEQIVDRFVELMVTGVMAQDSQMPSVRSMAMELSINPNTIQRAYAELERQGYIYSVKGKGSFVAENRHIMERRGQELLTEFRELAERAKNLGLPKERLLAVAAEVYEDGPQSAGEGKPGQPADLPAGETKQRQAGTAAGEAQRQAGTAAEEAQRQAGTAAGAAQRQAGTAAADDSTELREEGETS